MRKYEHSNELVNLVKQFLVDNDWHFFFDENTGVFEFGLRMKSKIQKINYLIDVHEDEIITYGICPVGADYEDLMPSTWVIKNSVHCIAAMFKCYAPGFVGIIFGSFTAKNAIAKCEKFPDDEVKVKPFEDADEGGEE